MDDGWAAARRKGNLAQLEPPDPSPCPPSRLLSLLPSAGAYTLPFPEKQLNPVRDTLNSDGFTSFLSG